LNSLHARSRIRSAFGLIEPKFFRARQHKFRAQDDEKLPAIQMRRFFLQVNLPTLLRLFRRGLNMRMQVSWTAAVWSAALASPCALA
jgi:hypothetical protein